MLGRGGFERRIHTLTGQAEDYDPVLELIGDARLVLIGEASHGTREFYEHRAALTRRLVAEHNFSAVTWEADWPDADRVHRFLRGAGNDPNPDAALNGFRRFPTWMWRNRSVLQFVDWLARHNRDSGEAPVGIYGLDLYSMQASIEAVLKFLDKTDAVAARKARERYACFDHFQQDPQVYGHATAHGKAESCEGEVVAQLLDLRRKMLDLTRDGPEADEAFFSAEQNARLVSNAERYYRALFRGRPSSWNMRDRHMMETLQEIIDHLGTGAKVVVWAHNSHLGDARATEMGERGELNLGQLVRELYGDESCLIGFSTFEGTVTAASDWGGSAERMVVRPGLAESFETLFHKVGAPAFFLDLKEAARATDVLREPRLQRAIGVVYRPETERFSHYFYTVLPDQFDGIFHIDRTEALEPLDDRTLWERGTVPETYPSGL